MVHFYRLKKNRFLIAPQSSADLLEFNRTSNADIKLDIFYMTTREIYKGRLFIEILWCEFNIQDFCI